MDLLTVIEHELGHVLGMDHQESGVMADTLFSLVCDERLLPRRVCQIFQGGLAIDLW